MLQVCTTLGMLTGDQARQLAGAGLTAYNHNLDTSPEYYSTITSSRKYQVWVWSITWFLADAAHKTHRTQDVHQQASSL